MIKNYVFSIALTLLAGHEASAQISGSGAYMKGFYVEVGIDSLGGYEGADTATAPIPAGMHFRSNNPYFGFVANPQMNSWATSAYDGDYYTPGTPENGWGFKLGGMTGSNNRNYLNDINGHITSYSYVSPYYSVSWEGDANSAPLHFRINYLLNENDLYYTTTVWVRNDSTDTIPDIYFYRNVDPDNNESITGDFATRNTIVDQAPAFGGSSVATVTATQSTPWLSTFAFIGDTTFVAGYGGFSNRDAAAMYSGTGFTQTVGATNFGDEAVYLACDIHNLAPSDSSLHEHRSSVASNERSFRYLTVFDSATTYCLAHNAISVNQTSYPDLSTTSSAFTLSGGSPAGGTYLGTGVSGGVFDPAVTGPGDFDIIYSYTSPSGCTGAAVSTIHVSDAATGISNHTIANNASLYPNPFTNEAVLSVGKSIQLQNAELHIYDVLGNDVKTIASINDNEIRIDRKELGAGMYFYRLINKGNTVANGRMIVK